MIIIHTIVLAWLLLRVHARALLYMRPCY